MILSDLSLRRVWRLLTPEPPDKAWQPASVDLCLSPQIMIVDPKAIADGVIVDMLHPDPSIWLPVTIPAHGYILDVGEPILGCTVESVRVPSDMVATLWGRSSVARCFTIVHATAGWGDPDFYGQWTLEIVNLHRLRVRIYPDMRIVQMNLMEMDSLPSRGYHQGGHYAGQTGPTPSRGAE